MDSMDSMDSIDSKVANDPLGVGLFGVDGQVPAVTNLSDGTDCLSNLQRAINRRFDRDPGQVRVLAGVSERAVGDVSRWPERACAVNLTNLISRPWLHNPSWARTTISADMDEDIFWKLVGQFDWDRTGDDDAVLEPAVRLIAAMAVEDIFQFSDILAEKLHALDTRKHCKACYAGELDPDNGDDYISADDFLYRRCVVVANGRGLFSRVLADPRRMPKNLEFEALLSLVPKAYERKTGQSFEHVSPVSYESFRNTDGWKPTGATRAGKYTGDNIPPGNRRPT